MIEVAIMIEGQNGLNWPRWQRLAQAVEALGFAGLFRSDHFTEAQPPDLDSLELWVSLTWLASHTQRIAFGPLVSPVSFRHPAMTARMAAAVDDLSRGRLVLGLGAGWQEREHANFGFDLLGEAERFVRFEEGLKIIQGLLRGGAPLDFQGTYYHLHDAVVLPHPARAGGPPILIGGNGAKRTLPLVARYADEWNAVFIPAKRIAELNARLNELLAARQRPISAVRRSLMTGCIFGRDEAGLRRRLDGRNQAELTERGMVAGTPSAIVEQLGTLAGIGIYRVMLQWLNPDDLDGIEALADTVLPQVSR